MKRTTWLLLPLLALLPLSAARAQAPVSSLSKLAVAIWPDYDRPSVLVLMTGSLGAEVPLPAVVTLPVPIEAQLNAVARIDEQRRMIDDIAYDVESGMLTLTTPNSGFQVEYYLPYLIEAGERSFTFTWMADLSVERLEATVQRPAAAFSLVTEPMAVDVMQGRDGLTYYRLPPQAVPAGQPFSLQVRYPMDATRLSVELQRAPADAPEAASREAEPASRSDFGMLAIVLTVVAVGLVSALVTWQLSRGRTEPLVRSAEGREQSDARRHCHSCQRSVAEEDRFCSNCGSKLEGG